MANEIVQLGERTLGADAWRDRLLKRKDGGPKALLHNALIALRHAPAWDGVLAYDTPI